MFDDGAAIRIANAAGTVHATIRVTGAGLHGLQAHGFDAIPEDTPIARTKWFAGVSLAPWANRLRDARWSYDGTEFRGAANEDHGHALHGLVYHHAFEVVAQHEDSVRLAYTLGADALYPWPVRIEVSYTVVDQGISCTIGATNLSATRVPLTLGVHPYLAFDDDTVITCPARSVCQNDERLIPTGLLLDAATRGFEPGTSPRLHDLSLDHCFTDLQRDTDGRAHTVLRHGDGTTVDVWQDAAFGYTQLFTKLDFPWASARRHGVGIEPQTGPANALQSGTDVIWLDPMESCTAAWGIVCTPARGEKD